MWERVRRGYTTTALLFTNACVLFLLLNAVALVWAPAGGPGDPLGWIENPPEFIVRAQALSFPELGPEERRALWRESQLAFEPDPLVQHRERAVAGRFVNVAPEGYRLGRDQGPWPPSAAAYNVAFLGGSTGFGYGVPDAATIPSQLQALLPDVDNRGPRLYNFARGGYNSTMERILFEKLAISNAPLDLAIFLDGVNDFAIPTDPAFLTRHMTKTAESESALDTALGLLPLVRAFRPSAWNVALEGRGAAPVFAPDDPEVLDRAIARYRENARAIEAIGGAHDIDVLFVWQPAPTYKYDLSHHTYKQQSFGGHERSRHGYPRMRASLDAEPLGPLFAWCADIQDEARELLYVDRMHYNPVLSGMIARCIADGLAGAG